MRPEGISHTSLALLECMAELVDHNLYVVSGILNYQISREKFEPALGFGPRIPVQVQIFLLRYDNVNFSRHRLCLFSLNNLIDIFSDSGSASDD